MNLRTALDSGRHLINPYPKGFSKSTVPEGKSGDWSVQKFTVTRDKVSLYNLRLMRDGYSQRIVPPGKYTRLVCNGHVVMSDTPAEAHEHYDALCDAKGAVLLNGLGLGFFLSAVVKKDGVTSVTVIEKSKDVIKLVGKHFKDDRVAIIQADAMDWRPPKGVRYGFVWHDIWTDICEDNKSEMSTLKRAYGRRTASQRCWSEEYL